MNKYYLFCYKLMRLTAAKPMTMFAVHMATIAAMTAAFLVVSVLDNLPADANELLCGVVVFVCLVGVLFQISFAVGVVLSAIRGADWGEEITPVRYDSDSDWM